MYSAGWIQQLSDDVAQPHELLEVRGFSEVVGRSQVHHLVPIALGLSSRHDENGRVRTSATDTDELQHFTAGPLGEVNVEKDELGTWLRFVTVQFLKQFDRLLAVFQAAQRGTEFRRFDGFPNEEEIGWIVLDYENVPDSACLRAGR
jgi:hypothetical protein